MKALPLIVLPFALAACASAPPPASVQPARTILQRSYVAPGVETVLGRLDAPEGALVARHIHHGVELGTIIEGQVEMTTDGEPPRVLGPGDSFAIPREKPHSARVLKGPLRVVSSWTIDIGKPLSEPAPAK